MCRKPGVKYTCSDNVGLTNRIYLQMVACKPAKVLKHVTLGHHKSRAFPKFLLHLKGSLLTFLANLPQNRSTHSNTFIYLLFNYLMTSTFVSKLGIQILKKRRKNKTFIKVLKKVGEGTHNRELSSKLSAPLKNSHAQMRVNV